MAILSYLQIFVGSWCAAVLYFFPNVFTYKQFVTVIAFVSAAGLIIQIIKRKGTLPRSFFQCVIALLLLIGAYMLTSVIYGEPNADYTGHLLVILAQIAPAALCAVLVARSEKARENIKRLAPVVSLIFTFIAFQGILHPTGISETGLINNENGMTYQSASYLVVYAAGLAEYYLISFRSVRWYRVFRNRIAAVLMFVLVLVDFFLALVAGGRGAIVLFGVVSLVAMFLWQRGRNSSPGGLITSLLVVAGLTGAAIYVIHLAATSEIPTSGFSRILLTIQTGESSGRDWVYESAWKVIADNPFFGHGLGSVYYTLGYYAHNFFLDAAVESGILGCGVWIALFGFAFWNLFSRVRKDLSEALWLILFLDGFVMSIFSGYYLSNIPIFWVIAFLFAREQEKKRELE